MIKGMGRLVRVTCMGFLLAVAASACSSAPKAVGMAVVGVNYTGDEYGLLVRDPQDGKNASASGELTPFSAGGQMCCFNLPATWRPGIRIQFISRKAIVENDSWVRDDESVKELELPPYADGQPGTLWLLQYPDGKVEAVSSTVSPENPKWPGTVKGWPVPSLAHRMKVWRIYYDQAVSDVAAFKRASADAKANPLAEATKAWKFDQKYSPARTKGFSGPEDVTYKAQLLQQYRDALESAQKNVDRLLAEQPK